MKNLRTKLSYALFCLVFTGCTADSSSLQEDTVNSSRVQKDTVENEFGDFGDGITILKVDKCEYVWVKRGYGGGLTHKGN